MSVYERFRILSHMKSLAEAFKHKAKQWYEMAAGFIAKLERNIANMSQQSFICELKNWQEIVSQGPEEIQSESFVF